MKREWGLNILLRAVRWNLGVWRNQHLWGVLGPTGDRKEVVNIHLPSPSGALF